MDTSDDDEWDPIDDLLENERITCVQLIRHFLWLEMQEEADIPEASSSSPPAATDPLPGAVTDIPKIDWPEVGGQLKQNTKTGKKKNKGKGKGKDEAPPHPVSIVERKDSKTETPRSSGRTSPDIVRPEATPSKNGSMPDVIKIES